MFHWRCQRKFRVSPQILRNFYSSTIKGMLTRNITAWYGNSTKQDHKALQRVVNLAECTIGAHLPCIKHVYTRCCSDNCLFTLLRLGRRYQIHQAALRGLGGLHKMTETVFGKNLFDVYFEFLFWPTSHLLTWGGVYDLRCSWTPRGD